MCDEVAAPAAEELSRKDACREDTASGARTANVMIDSAFTADTKRSSVVLTQASNAEAQQRQDEACVRFTNASMSAASRNEKRSQ